MLVTPGIEVTKVKSLPLSKLHCISKKNWLIKKSNTTIKYIRYWVLWRQTKQRDEIVEIVSGVIWEGFTEKTTFELMPEGGVKVCYVTVCRKSLPDRGKSKSTTCSQKIFLPCACLWPGLFPFRRLLPKCSSLSCLKLSTALGTNPEFLTMAYQVFFNPFTPPNSSLLLLPCSLAPAEYPSSWSINMQTVSHIRMQDVPVLCLHLFSEIVIWLIPSPHSGLSILEKASLTVRTLWPATPHTDRIYQSLTTYSQRMWSFPTALKLALRV